MAGLATAWDLVAAGEPGLRVTVLEAAPDTGGKLRTGTVAGLAVDVGAESVLARRPEAVDLAREAGLGDALTHPGGRAATVWSRGAHHPLPPRTLMGVPSDPDTARGLLDDAEVERVRAERSRPLAPLEADDVAVGALVEDRLGAAVVDRLVEPLLAGVYAGHARRLSARATVPALWAAARAGEPLLDAAARAAAGATATAGGHPSPVFAGYRGGLGRMAADLTQALRERGVDVRTGTTVRGLRRTGTGWALTVGPTVAEEEADADAVVLAVPAAPAARLLHDVAPDAAAALGEIGTASMAVVTLAVPRRVLAPVLEGAGVAGSTGFLVPPTEPVRVKAATFTFAKWAWVDALDPELVVLRASVGRAGEEAALQRDDADLVATVVDDLSTILRGRVPAPVGAHVQRWGGGLPQYAVGHLDRVARVRDAVAAHPGLAVAGASYDGVGVPAVVATGRAAAARVLEHLRAHPPAGG
ncbi:protoporphyrinogen oxidase [Lapillicoccus jejuensis]